MKFLYIMSVIASVLFFFGFEIKNKNEDDSVIIVNLNHEVSDSVNLQIPMLTSFYTLKSINKFPLLKDDVESYKGIPKHDSIFFYMKYEDPYQEYYELYKNKKINKENFLEIIKKDRIDTLELSNKCIKQGFIALVGFYKNKLFISADLNRNKDFSDDYKYEFDINIEEDKIDCDFINKLEKLDYEYEFRFKKNIIKYKRKLIFLPQKNVSKHLPNEDIEYTSKFIYKDFWKGELNIDNVAYEIYYHGISADMGGVYVKPKSIKFSCNDIIFNNQFLYNPWDTLIIGRKRFVLDSINNSISKIYLKKVKGSNFFGNIINTNIDDFQVYDLNGKKIKLKDQIKNKKYTLLDFWGTWCGPCIKQIPYMKGFNDKFSDKVSLISIAKDENISKVKEYVKNKELNWQHLIINKTFDSSIINDLNISYYPTLILLDENGKILYKGGDLKEIEEIIKENQYPPIGG